MKKSKLKLKKKHFKKIKKNKNIKSYKFNFCNLKNKKWQQWYFVQWKRKNLFKKQ